MMGEIEAFGKNQQPQHTPRRKKSLVKNPSARAGPGVQKLKKKFEESEVEEVEEVEDKQGRAKQEVLASGQVVVLDGGGPEARL